MKKYNIFSLKMSLCANYYLRPKNVFYHKFDSRHWLFSSFDLKCRCGYKINVVVTFVEKKKALMKIEKKIDFIHLELDEVNPDHINVEWICKRCTQVCCMFIVKDGKQQQDE